MSVPEDGRALGSRYVLVEQLGRGAAGEVWRAWDRQAASPVAAKLLWPRHAADPEILARFVNERAVLLGLHHPNIVRVHDFVVEGEDLAIVMDLVAGPSLATLLDRCGTLPPAVAVPLAAAVLDALGSAHARGVTHRDVKPDNVMLAGTGDPRPEDVRLTDFGVAGIVLDEAAAVTELIGTPGYMAPELVSYGRSGPASDVYAVGVLLYELIAGRTPFAGEGTTVTVALRHVTSAPPPLPVDEDLWRLLDAMLAKDPARRGTAEGCAARLRALTDDALAGEALPVQPEPPEWPTATEVLPDRATVDRALAADPSQPSQPAERDGMDDVAVAQTSMRALRPTGPRADRPAAALAALAQDAPADEHGLTMAKAAPRVEPPTPRAATSRWSARRRALVAAGAVVVLAVGGLVVWRSGLLTRQTAAADDVEITTAAAHANGIALPTGLRIDLEARYDSAEQATALTVTMSGAPNAPLTGDVLLVLPGAVPDAGCGQVTEQVGVVEPVRASTDGLEIPCGVRLPGVQVQPGATVTVPLAVDLELVDADGAVVPDYGPWLTEVQRATDSALAAITGTAFPAQRVTGIAVEPTSVTLAGTAAPVPYRVVARWSGAGPQEGTDLLTGATTDGMEVELLLDLTGGTGLDGVAVHACAATQVIGIRVLAEQPEQSCSLEVEIGALRSSGASFGIQMR